MSQGIMATVREKRPLVLCLTNTVTENFCANVLLAVGAAPIMSHAGQEMRELVAIADALVINPGTLDDAFILRAELAIQAAKEKSIPVVFDPVGAGASDYRLSTALNLLASGAPMTLKANASEVMALAGAASQGRGVDSGDAAAAAIGSAKQIMSHSSVEQVVITGCTDYVVSPDATLINTQGDAMMAQVTGMGCALNGVLAATLAVDHDPDQCAVSALASYTAAAERSAKVARGPGSFAVSFLDELSR